MTIADIGPIATNKGLNEEIERIGIKMKEMISDINTNTTGIALINSALDAIPDPVTISLSTLTLAAINAAFETQVTQLKTLIDGIQA
jgi:hypothetical protein